VSDDDAHAAAIVAHPAPMAFVFSVPPRSQPADFDGDPEGLVIMEIVWEWFNTLPPHRSINERMADGFRRRDLGRYLRNYRRAFGRRPRGTRQVPWTFSDSGTRHLLSVDFEDLPSPQEARETVDRDA
jgi:hypothetical protein